VAIGYRDDTFDITYCFHSSWYFPDVNAVIDEMLRVTRTGGLVMFDIQNQGNWWINRAYRRRIFHSSFLGRMLRYCKNAAKIMLGRGTPIWLYVLYETPTHPESIYTHLTSLDISTYSVMAARKGGSLEVMAERGSLSRWPRLVFAIPVRQSTPGIERPDPKSAVG
jgi:hypothetical protein